jgi:acetyl esterase/lipase
MKRQLPLWPHRQRPQVKVTFPHEHHPVAHKRPAMLVFRGGAYSTPTGSGGGTAEWAAQQNMVGVEVEYGTRSTNGFYPQNYADAARAVRLVRHHAAEWGIDPKQICVTGFSAGGHLATLLSTRPELVKVPEDDLAQQWSARPDLVVLGYPLISFLDGYTDKAFVNSVSNFCGHNDVPVSTRRHFSNEFHVTEDHPPVFIWTTREDALVPYSHAQSFAEACSRANVPVEYMLYESGPHGMGLAFNHVSDAREWTSRMLSWMHNHWGAHAFAPAAVHSIR